jgi:hypothetical protein
VLLLCISPAALASGWVALERSTAVHRDPANAGRRFIPLLLGDCALPDTLRRYKVVDFREESDAAFAAVLATCRESRHDPAPVTTAPPEAIPLDSKSPLSEAAKEILKAREDAGQFSETALHVIRKPHPGDPRQTMYFIDEATAPGSDSLRAMKSRVLQPAIDDLRRHGYLDEPFAGPGTLVYEFLR